MNRHRFLKHTIVFFYCEQSEQRTGFLLAAVGGPKGRCLEIVGRRRRPAWPEGPLFGSCWPPKAAYVARRAAIWSLLAAEGGLRGPKGRSLEVFGRRRRPARPAGPLFGSGWPPKVATRPEGPLLGTCWLPKGACAALRKSRCLEVAGSRRRPTRPEGPLFGSCWPPQRGSKGRYLEVVGRRSRSTQP